MTHSITIPLAKYFSSITYADILNDDFMQYDVSGLVHSAQTLSHVAALRAAASECNAEFDYDPVLDKRLKQLRPAGTPPPGYEADDSFEYILSAARNRHLSDPVYQAAPSIMAAYYLSVR